ncbi:oligosaccharide repeat unit polymerase [Aeromonas hydrophila]|uniref:oligosaccharide repeat unit polymerase n=1 Tax=Aeromonas hydrophila TaxID=644 RepID=UPI000FD17314|nr:oligosaccharide repeat unit polymerase [Aeromonas hydrophila]AZU48777.1 putative membrane protein [Aeromonas hydrophila]WDA25899.1 oligosaccharide repeat unit polymerase [Aeromonas hydrophila]WES91776.1 oligosaccharide repeat unit polymerase [Aeromonas hydrophila]
MLNIKACIILMYFIINILSFYIVSYSMNYGNTLNYISVYHTADLTTPLFVVILSYVLVYIVVSSGINDNKLSKINNNRVRYFSIDIFYLFVLSYNMAVFFSTGIGRAGGSVEGVGFLQSILPIYQITFIYYAAIRLSQRKWSFLLLFIGCLFILIKGWSSHIMILIIAEVIYILYFKRISIYRVFLAIILGGISLIVFFYIYKLKYFFRLGAVIDVDFFFFLEYALSRLSAFSNFSYLYDIGDGMNMTLSLYGKGHYFVVTEMLSSLIPKSWLGMDNYRALDNIFGISYVNSSLDTSGFSITLPGILLIAYNFSIVSFLISIVTLLVVIKTISCVMVRMHGLPGYAIAFSLICYINYSGSIKELALFLYAIILFSFCCLLLRFILVRLVTTSSFS